MSDATAPAISGAAPRTRWRPGLSPVTRQELADRFRGSRGGMVVTGYVALLALALMLLYLIMSSIARFDSGVGFAAVGRSMFDSFMGIQLAAVMFFGAGYAASQVASEREKRTLPLLQITSLTPLGIVAGKWWAVTAWQVLLLIVGMPLAAAAAFFGGVTLTNVIVSTLYMVVVVGAFSAIAIAVSAMMRRTTTAIVVTYGLLGALMIGPGVLAIIEFLITEDVPRLAMFFHPLTGLAFAAGTPASISLPTLLTPFRLIYVEDLAFAGAGGAQPSMVVLLLAQIAMSIAVTVVALRFAARRVTPGHGPRHRESSRLKDPTDDGSVVAGAAPAGMPPPRGAGAPSAPPPPPPAPAP